MKRLIPVLVAIVLIFIVVGVSFGGKVKDKYTLSGNQADLKAYYGLTDDTQGAIIMQDEILEDKGIVKDGTFYFSYDTVSDYFIYTRLYVNEEENNIRYVLPDRIISANIGDASYLEGTENVLCDYTIAFYQGDMLYVAADFVRLFTIFDYEIFTEPNRIQIYTDYQEIQVAEVKKDTQVRYQGGVKSDVLRQLSKGEQVTVLEQMETWSKVKTGDSLIGYVQNKKLDEATAFTPDFANNTSMYGEEEFTSIKKDYKISMVWHQVSGQAGNDTLSSMIAQTKSVNTISPTWFYLSDAAGNIASYASQSYVDKAHSMGMEVWALADDFTANVDEYAVFSSSENRQRLIDNLMNQVLTYGIDGINIDFEHVSQDAGKHFVEFIRELSIPCRKNGIVLSVDNYPPSGGAIWYNRREQATYCDYVVLMGYDEHWGTGGEAGSVSSINYVETGLKDTLEYVPAEKLINGIPFYTRIWKTTGTETTGESTGMSGAASFVAQNGITTQWNEETCQNYGEIQKGDTLYQVWLEDAQSLKVKLDVMSTYDLAGVSGWKLGLETADVWDLIQSYVSQ